MKKPSILPKISSDGIESINRLFGEFVNNSIPSVVAAIANKNQVVYQEAFGMVDVTNNVQIQNDSIFRIASMTKPITSTAIMILFEECKLDLDDPVSKYIPFLKDPGIMFDFNENEATYKRRSSKKDISVRHLLTQTSGYGYGFTNPVLYVLEKKTGKYPLALPLLHEPGSKWTYGMGTHILGAIIEKISNQSLESFFREKIFKPLDMKNTFYKLPSEDYSRWVTIHQRKNEEMIEIVNPIEQEIFYSGAAGLLSTASDYIKFLQMFLNGGIKGKNRILKEESIQTMTKNQIGKLFIETQQSRDPAFSNPFPIGAGKDKFGFGFQIKSKKRNHSQYRSTGSYSWVGLFNTFFWVDPVKNIAVVLLMQMLPFYDEKCLQLAADFEKLIYNSLSHKS